MNEETKRCPKCELNLPHARFSSRGNGRLCSYCKGCQSVSARNHYVANKSAYMRRRDKWDRVYRLRNRSYAHEFLKTHPCVDCGEADPIVLEFDHVDPDEKEFNVSDLMRSGYSIETLKREIARCDVRCANCHRLRTAVQFGWKEHIV